MTTSPAQTLPIPKHDLSALLSPEELERWSSAVSQGEERLAEEEAHVLKIIAEHYAERRHLARRELLRLVLAGESLPTEAALNPEAPCQIPVLPLELIAMVERVEEAIPLLPPAPSPPTEEPQPSVEEGKQATEENKQATEEPPAAVAEEPSPALPENTARRGITSEELAVRAGISRSVLVRYHQAGVVTHIPGTGTDWHNPRLYEESAIALVKAEKARRAQQRREHLKVGASRSKKLGKLPGGTYTAKSLAEVLGCGIDSIRFCAESGLLTAREGTGTSPHNPRLFDVPDLATLAEEIKKRRERRSAIAINNLAVSRQARSEAAQQKEAQQKEAQQKEAHPKPASPITKPASPTPEPAVQTLEPQSIPLPEDEQEESGPSLVPLERAARHPYHWIQALTCASEHLAALPDAQAPAPFEIAYKPEEGFRAQEVTTAPQSSGMAPQSSGMAPEAGLLPFVLLSPPAEGETGNRWTCTITASRKGWLFPMAVHFRAQWQRQQADRQRQQVDRERNQADRQRQGKGNP